MLGDLFSEKISAGNSVQKARKSVPPWNLPAVLILEPLIWISKLKAYCVIQRSTHAFHSRG